MTICSKYPKELTHYDKQLKKKCFGKLKENVWETKTKWQLMLKAQRNYHHKLILSSFRAWAAFTAYKLRKREKLEKANEHYVRKAKSKTFSILKRKVEKRWALKKKLCLIENFKIKKRAWNYWRKYVKKSQRSKEIYVLTSKMRETYLLRNYLHVWFANYIEKNFTEMKYFRAVIHHNFALKRRSFTEWMNYKNQKYFKRELASHLLSKLELKLKKRVFTRLMQYTQHRKLYLKHLHCITLFYETYLLKSVIDKWLVKYESKIESRNREKQDLAVKFYEESLLAKSFRRLKTWSDDEKLRNDASNLFLSIKIKLYLVLWRKYHREKVYSSALEEKAQKWRNHQLKFIYLIKMMESLEEKRRESDQIENFIRFCDARLISESFHKFRQFLIVKKIEKAKYNSAQHHHDIKITQKCFRQLQTYTTRRIRKKNIVNHYNFRLLSKSFNKIRCYSRIKRFHRDCINKFQERCRLQTLRRVFSVLNNKTKNNRLKFFFAREVADRKIKMRTFQNWKKFHETKAQKNMIVHRSRLILQDVLIINVITQWWKKSQMRTKFKQELSKLKSNQEKRLVKNYLKKWLQIIDKFRILREKLKTFDEVYAEIIVQRYLSKIFDEWKGRRMIKDKLDLAVRAEKIWLMRRYYNRWITYISWKKDKLRECSARILLPIQLGEKRSRFSKVKPRRKQPMIPLFLKDELSPLQDGSTFSDRFSSNDTYYVSSPVSENLPVIY